MLVHMMIKMTKPRDDDENGVLDENYQFTNEYAEDKTKPLHNKDF